jgi:hypothetical protein
VLRGVLQKLFASCNSAGVHFRRSAGRADQILTRRASLLSLATAFGALTIAWLKYRESPEILVEIQRFSIYIVPSPLVDRPFVGVGLLIKASNLATHDLAVTPVEIRLDYRLGQGKTRTINAVNVTDLSSGNANRTVGTPQVLLRAGDTTFHVSAIADFLSDGDMVRVIDHLGQKLEQGIAASTAGQKVITTPLASLVQRRDADLFGSSPFSNVTVTLQSGKSNHFVSPAAMTDSSPGGFSYTGPNTLGRVWKPMRVRELDIQMFPWDVNMPGFQQVR